MNGKKSEAVIWRCSVKTVPLKILPEACNFIKKETLVQAFSCELCIIFKNTFFYRTPLVTASVKYKYAVNARFTQGLLQLFLIFWLKNILNEHIIYKNFAFLIEKSF